MSPMAPEKWFLLVEMRDNPGSVSPYAAAAAAASALEEISLLRTALSNMLEDGDTTDRRSAMALLGREPD